MPLIRAFTLFVLAFAATASAAAESVIRSQEHAFRVVTVARGLEFPWSLAFLPDGRRLVTERPGRLRFLNADWALDPQPVQGLPEIAASGQGGLLDVVPHPRFAENELIYFSYSARGAGGIGTEVARGRLVDHRLENVEVLFRQQPKSGGGRHFGSRLVFDRQGLLYITLGDRGEQERAQKMDDLAGKIVRLHDDGRIPQDNPFVKRAGARPEIFSLGNRNVQGATLHPTTGELWTHEHGPQGGDEVNIIRAGRNYGWPTITYGVEYGIGTKIGEGVRKPGMEQPLHIWVPSIAPSGLAIYRGDRFPRWRGDLFVGALRGQELVRLRFDGERQVQEERLLEGVLGRIRDVRAGPDGYLYLLTDSGDGVIARLEPATAP
ncbi:MAG: PQQ-dependent sugar dehydrogenase [Candidatus Competibacteraceae bacterium]|nr:PQQ-dependent sugar dehydrogenase [Candidatus Competibacteraceae bacterium]